MKEKKKSQNYNDENLKIVFVNSFQLPEFKLTSNSQI